MLGAVLKKVKLSEPHLDEPNKLYCSSTCRQQIYPAQLEAATETVSQTVSESSIGINPFLTFRLIVGAVIFFTPPTKRQPDVVPKSVGLLRNYGSKNTR